MSLGVFSVNPTVKDLQRHRSFYEKFGVTVVGGGSGGWLAGPGASHRARARPDAIR